MRPVKFGPFAPITALATAFNAQGFTSTGAAVAPTTLNTSDGLAHPVTLTAPVQATLDGLTFTVTGLDADRFPQVESGLVGPVSGATVTTTKLFSRVDTVKPSATMGGLTVSIGVAATSLSPSFILSENLLAAANLSLVVSGTLNVTVNDTIADVWGIQPSTLPWGAITALTSKTANTDGTARSAATAVQVLTNSVTNGATYSLWLGQMTGND